MNFASRDIDPCTWTKRLFLVRLLFRVCYGKSAVDDEVGGKAGMAVWFVVGISSKGVSASGYVAE